MSNVYLDDSLLTSIGDSIRGKNGATDKYTPAEMATAITNLPTSSATLVTKSITVNGTYNASDDSADGYSSVEVNVPSSGGSEYEYPFVANIIGPVEYTAANNYTADVSITAQTSNSMIFVYEYSTAAINTGSLEDAGFTTANYTYWYAGWKSASKGETVSFTTDKLNGSSATHGGYVVIEFANANNIEFIKQISKSWTSNSSARYQAISYSDSDPAADGTLRSADTWTGFILCDKWNHGTTGAATYEYTNTNNASASTLGINSCVTLSDSMHIYFNAGSRFDSSRGVTSPTYTKNYVNIQYRALFGIN